MGALGDRAAAHFKNLLQRDPIEVPEWGTGPGEPLIIYGRAVSVKDAKQIYTAGSKSSFDMFVEAMILLATDKNGKPLFDLTDKAQLRRSSHEIVERIGTYLLKARDDSELNPDIDTAVKN